VQPTIDEVKTLPHSEESERAVLAAVLLDAENHLPKAAARLRTEDFYFERHQLVYQGMLDLQTAGAEVDLRTVQARLEQQRALDLVGGVAYLASLDVDLPDLSRVESYVEIVKERALRRRLMRACSDVYRSCLDGGLEAKEALDRAEQAILELGEQAIPRGFVALADVFHDTVVDLEERPDNPFPGLPTGFIDLDAITHGLHPGNLIILAGRPGMGKTSLALNVAQNVTLRGSGTVGIFSLEMSQQELALRVLCSEADVSFSRLRAGRVSQREWKRIHDTVRQASAARLFIDDTASPTLLEVSSKARRLKAERKLDLLVVDYLQLMQAGGRFENRNLEIGAITRGLKALAKEIRIPVVVLSQLSRQPERRGSDHRPQLADLRESGAIEQDADLVAFIYRDEVYHPDDPSNQGIAELIIAKHRNGETGTIELAFFGDTTTFRSLDKRSSPPDTSFP
jgi:replicative DNA helicase